MGDSEERIEYTPEELNEIDRILDLMPGESAPQAPAEEPGPVADVPGGGDLSAIEDIEPIDDIEPIEDIETFDDIEAPPEDISAELQSLDEAPASADDVEDITDLISVDDEVSVPEEGRAVELPEETADFAAEEDIMPAGDLLEEIEELPSFEEEPLPDKGPPPRDEVPAPRKAASPLDELEALTSMEPESVDLQDISDDRFVGDTAAPPPEADDDLGDLDEIAGDMPLFEEPAAEAAEGVKLEDGGGLDIGDLSDISMEDISDIPEAGDDEFPEISLEGSPMAIDDEASVGMEEPDGFSADEIPEPLSLEDLEDAGTPSPAATEAVSPMDMDREPAGGIPGIEELEDIVRTEDLSIPEPEEEAAPPPRVKPSAAATEEGVELSARELQKLKTALQLIHPELRKVVKETILNDLLPPGEIRQMVDMIIKGKPEENIHRFLEKKLGRSIDISAEPVGKKRQVIVSRPSYTKEGMDRQKRLLKRTGIAAVAAVTAFTVTILSYQFIYKPVMARKQIAKGVGFILEPGDPVTKKVEDYRKAEEIFDYVDQHYKKDYLPGYNKYARAYFDKREYPMAFQKLQKAYSIKPSNIETLNSLGYFYSRVPDSYYRRIRPADSQETKLDMAIRFYKTVLAVKPDNVTALYGIGNTYMHQGKYLDARRYYENILKVDRKSVIGHAGLLNLYIERDAFPEVLTTHYDLADKKILSELPQALLGKLAAYYLGKKRTDKTNIRVDYGIQSARLKDLADNPFPAARAVLDALHKKDPHYPPQYLLYAKLSREDQNLAVMRGYLETALKEEPVYFGALHMMGEYHYEVNEPVKAYEYFNRAIKAAAAPPEFTRDDFYFETEKPGKTYFYLGNIFYYFFDRVNYRYGDELEEKELDADTEQMANYTIALENYQAALKEGYTEPEMAYNLGRIYYMKGQHEKALDQWMSLYEDFVANPEIMFALGNAFYHTENLGASQGEYLKLITLFEREAESIKSVFPEREDHLKIFQTLASAYNNLGAVYQKRNNETKSNLSYWKAIDYAARINRENEFARVNMARAFKERTEPIAPILDENIPYSLRYFSADFRKNR
ncbi:MAG TPA: tetratricopeptide repeat protein [Spirochaetes bacterium]|nr:tetratricopeptide repeat protein [Spirochaetota bacterium]